MRSDTITATDRDMCRSLGGPNPGATAQLGSRLYIPVDLASDETGLKLPEGYHLVAVLHGVMILEYGEYAGNPLVVVGWIIGIFVICGALLTWWIKAL